ncbi:MAG: CPBP family intramembrane metalloprotease [Rhodobacteraceae bacterium]|nr:MAG: CPBP family intramembrane metalloprotease [Paracoccaceae bacterium]
MFDDRLRTVTADFSSHIDYGSEIWRIILGIILVSVFYTAVNFGLAFLGNWFSSDLLKEIFISEQGLGHSPMALAGLFVTFLPVWFALALVLPLVHRRTPLALLGPSQLVNWQQFFTAAKVVLILAFGFEVLFQIPVLLLDLPLYNAHMALDLPQWALWLLPMLLLLFVQIGAEELLFRGYLLQMIRARGGGFWLSIALPSLAFGLLHYSPATYGQNAFLVVAATTALGILLCKVTLRTGNLGAALGIHFANNLTVMFLLGIDGNMNGMALFSTKADLSSPLMSGNLILMIILMLAVYRIWTRRMDNARSLRDVL